MSLFTLFSTTISFLSCMGGCFSGQGNKYPGVWCRPLWTFAFLPFLSIWAFILISGVIVIWLKPALYCKPCEAGILSI